MVTVPVKKFARNTEGKDFIVGDIHGMFRLLDYKLIEIGFDATVDRLFSVGDLVDRGPDSLEFMDWLEKPWFHAVRGNHEQMVIDGVRESGRAAQLHMLNGGEWLYGRGTVEMQFYALACEELPLAIEVDTAAGPVGIVHAEVPLDDWQLFQSMYDSNTYRFDSVAMWSRTRITSGHTNHVTGLHKLYVGHTPMNYVKQLGNVIYIDTGACFTGGSLTILQLN